MYVSLAPSFKVLDYRCRERCDRRGHVVRLVGWKARPKENFSGFFVRSFRPSDLVRTCRSLRFELFLLTFSLLRSPMRMRGSGTELLPVHVDGRSAIVKRVSFGSLAAGAALANERTHLATLASTDGIVQMLAAADDSIVLERADSDLAAYRDAHPDMSDAEVLMSFLACTSLRFL